MVLWQWINDYLPPYAEQITINEEVEQIQETISQFKHLVPEGYKKLEPAKKNNWGSTEGMDKLLCERYLFERENKRIWLDIPHELMEKLELPKGKTCPWPFYLNPKVLEPERKETEGAITIDNEEEIFLEKPFTIDNLEEDIESYRKKIEDLKKEKGWWDKWIRDGRVFIKPTSHQTATLFWPSDNFSAEQLWDEIYDGMPHSLRNIKSKIKEKVYQHYRDK
jgi:hypothetical protein